MTLVRGREAWTTPQRSLPVLHVHQAHSQSQFGALQPLQKIVAEFALEGQLRAEGADNHVMAEVDGSSLLLVQPDGGEQLLQLQLFFAHVTLSERNDVATGKPVLVLQTLQAASQKCGDLPTLSMGDLDLELQCNMNRYVCRQCMQRGLTGVRWCGTDKKAHNVCLSCAPLKESAETWLFVVDGDINDAHAMLSIMSAAGALRENPQNEYQIQEETLGVGSNATVHLAVRNGSDENDPDAEKFAVKIFNAHKDTSREKELDTLRAELSVLITLQRHPNIVQFHGVYQMDMSTFKRRVPNQSQAKVSPLGFSVVMEHCCGGDLFDAVRHKRFSEDRARKVMIGVLKGLSHIHERGIVHRDVKPENVLLAPDDRAVLTDFGISCRVSDKTAMARTCGSPGYVAPEVLCGKASGIIIDSFSAGSLLHFLIAGKMPFHGSSIPSILSKTLRCEVDFKKNPYLHSTSRGCKEFIAALLCKSQKHRPTAQLALSSEWITNVMSPELQPDGCVPNVEDIRARRMMLLKPPSQRSYFPQGPGSEVAGPAPSQIPYFSEASTCSTHTHMPCDTEPYSNSAAGISLVANFSSDTFQSNITDMISRDQCASWNSSMLEQVLGSRSRLPPSSGGSFLSSASCKSTLTDEMSSVDMRSVCSAASASRCPSESIAYGDRSTARFPAGGRFIPRGEGNRYFRDNPVQSSNASSHVSEGHGTFRSLEGALGTSCGSMAGPMPGSMQGSWQGSMPGSMPASGAGSLQGSRAGSVAGEHPECFSRESFGFNLPADQSVTPSNERGGDSYKTVCGPSGPRGPSIRFCRRGN